MNGRPKTGLNIAFFGSSLVSAYWNGAATYYRGIIRQLHERGHRITFYEPDAYDRQRHRDIADPDWAEVVVYSAEDRAELVRCLEAAAQADVVVKASGVGVYDEFLEAAVADLGKPGTLAIFWDVDAPATLERVQAATADPFRAHIPPLRPDPDLRRRRAGGGRLHRAGCLRLRPSTTPSTSAPTSLRRPTHALLWPLGLPGNRLPDRGARRGILPEARGAPAPRPIRTRRQRLAGQAHMPPNVAYVGHASTPPPTMPSTAPRAWSST
ncbi:MAG: hypothetical protein R2851_02990 [Caldilineaceae bacterium]